MVKEINNQYRWYFMSGLLICFSISIIIESMKYIDYRINVIGVLGASIFMGIGLLPFPIRTK